jgi:hypothetical protein
MEIIDKNNKQLWQTGKTYGKKYKLGGMKLIMRIKS